MNEKYALIWRKSVYDNEFRCTKCGAKLMKPGGRLGRAQILPEHNVICADCGYHVAYIKPYDGPLGCLYPSRRRWSNEQLHQA